MESSHVASKSHRIPWQTWRSEKLLRTLFSRELVSMTLLLGGNRNTMEDVGEAVNKRGVEKVTKFLYYNLIII